MTPSRDPVRSRPRYLALAVPLAVLALLSFLWPFVRVPRLGLVEAWAHLFGAWAILIAALLALVGALGRSSPRRDAPRKDASA